MKNYCVVPPFVSQSVPPLVMLVMSKDQQMYFKAYTDTQDLDSDGVPDVTYKDSIKYYGLFDQDKCYSYTSPNFIPTNWVDGYVAPPGNSTNHYCTAATGKWSGNFLNWATMSRIDILRKVLYGGKRTKDIAASTNSTILSKSLVPNDAHAFAKVYTGADISKLTPSTCAASCVSTSAQSAITICNANSASTDTAGNFSVYWGQASLGPATPSNTTGQYYPDAATTDGLPQCDLKYNGGAALSGGTAYNGNIYACYSSTLLEPNCMVYSNGTSYKPTGLLQKYGTNRHGSTNSADWENQMYFGLITGSYDKNKSGGVLRSEIHDIGQETSSTDGTVLTATTSKIIKTLNNLTTSTDFVYGTGWATNCPSGLTFTEGTCKDWGNPVGEMYYEAMRYFKGIGSARYGGTDTGVSNLTIATWDNPYSVAGRGSCQKPFILMLSDIYPSFDSDQLPGSNWAASPSGAETGLPSDVKTLLNSSNSHMNELELTNPGVASVFAGEANGVNNSECTAKATTDLSNVRGQCPEEPTKEGSFYMPGMAWWAHTTGVDNPTGTNHKITTFAVATPTTMPNIEFKFGSNTVQMLPVFKDRTSGSKGQLANFSIVTTATPTEGTCPAGSTNCVPCPALDTECTTEQANGYQYGYEIMYDDSTAGNDYDLDVKYRIYVKTNTGANTLTIKTKGSYASAVHSDAAGYIITGVSGTNGPGEYLEITCGGDAGGTDCDRFCNDASTNTVIGGTTYAICNGTVSSQKYIRNYANAIVRVCTAATWVNCTVNADCSSVIAGDTCAAASTQTMADSEIVRVFNVTGSTSGFLENPLYYAAKYGGFTDNDANHYPNLDAKWKDSSRNLPNTYFFASNPSLIEVQLEKAFNAILDRASSGTAASVLASGEGNGANLLQAAFFPKKSFFGGTEAQWTGSLQNLWYYIDPKTSNSTIREDSNSDKTMQLNSDKILNFYFDGSHTTAKLYADSNGDGVRDNPAAPETVELDDLKSLWDGGLQLFKTTAANRRIYTPLDITTVTKQTFNSSNCTNRFIATTTDLDSCGSNLAAIRPLLNTDADVTGGATADKDTVAKNIINYVRGADQSTFTASAGGTVHTYRTRKVSIDLNRDGDNNDAGEVAEWKLGDIVNSTPKILSWTPLNTYHNTHNDTTYYDFLHTSTVQNRGMVFAGANDGMLHAFKLGKFQFVNDGTMTKAKLLNPDTGSACSDSDTAKCGREMWSFIPRNVLPYLKYYKHKDYCHLYYVDGTPFMFDASIEAPGLPASGNYWDQTRTVNSWRTILIGSMRLGGACANTTCDESAYAVGNDCIQTPVDNQGLSSYFALDVTDPNTPIFLWEFADPALGLATTGPAIVKIKARTSVSGNPSSANDSADGRWFVVLASGPTGYVDATTHQFSGHSKQNLKLFVLDLKTGAQATTAPIDTGIPYAFGSSLYNAAADYDLDYQDDAAYIGYTMSEVAAPVSTTKWTAGGVLRLITREDLTGNDPGTVTGACGATSTALNANCWLATKVIEGSLAAPLTNNIGPVTSSIGHIAHYPTNSTSPDKAWLYFGTGRYFFKTASSVDNPGSGETGTNAFYRKLFGVQEPCLSKIKNITTTSSPVCSDTGTVCAGTGDRVDAGDFSCLEDQTTAPSATLAAGKYGWYIELDHPASGSSYYERVITDPLVTPNGMTFFTTFAPTTDICGFGGNSYLWAVRYDTGGAIGSALKGKALLQVSTGEIKEINLSDAFSEKEGRRTFAMPGVPPAGQGLTLVIPPKAIDRILHIRNK